MIYSLKLSLEELRLTTYLLAQHYSHLNNPQSQHIEKQQAYTHIYQLIDMLGQDFIHALPQLQKKPTYKPNSDYMKILNSIKIYKTTSEDKTTKPPS